MKIVVLDGYTENPGDLSWDGFEALGELTVYDRTPAEETVQRIGDHEAVVVNKVKITREILDACPGVKYVGVLATGYNVVDVQAAAERGVTVCNIPAYGTAAVAQMVFALLLEICHHVGAHSEAVHQGEWSASVDFCFWKYPLIELAGKTMGIIGFGRIGQNTAMIAKAMGMHVLAYNPSKNQNANAYGEYMPLDTLLAQSDIISLHCPLLPSTEGMINKARIAQMKDGVILINTARGQLIVEQDLADALETGKVYAAAVDVVSVEPIHETNPLLRAKNCLITPHIAWASKESRERLMSIAVENLKAFLEGNPVNVVSRGGV